MKKILSFLIPAVVFLIVAVFAWNFVVKTAVEKGVAVVTGMPLSIKKIDVGLFSSSVDIEGLVLKNPAGFHDTIFVDIPKVFVSYDLPAVFTGKVHLKKLEFDLKQFSVVKNEKGALNLDSLKALAKAQEPAKKAPSKTEPAKKDQAPLSIQIDLFNLKVGKASYIDYSGGKESVNDFNIGLDETYRDITDPNKLVALIVVKVMMRTPLAMLSGFNLGGLQGSVSGILGSATDVAGQFASKGYGALKSTASVVTSDLAGQTASGVTSGAKSAAGSVTSGVKTVTSSLKSKFKIPFKQSAS